MRLFALLIALLVAASVVGGAATAGRVTNCGCAAESVPGSASSGFDRTIEEAAEEYNITVVGGELPFDPNRTFARAEKMVDRDVEPPDAIVIGTSSEPADPNRFRELLGFETWGRPATTALFSGSGAATENRTIFINEEVIDQPTRAERGVAHEFFHVIQFQSGVSIYPAVFPDDDSVDSQMAWYAGVEGVAHYLEHAYWERYLANGTNPVDSLDDRYARGDVDERWFLSRYVYGISYVESRVDGPGDAIAQSNEVPVTTEGILDGVDPGEAVLAPLAVESGPGTWAERDRTRMGELFLRIVLSGELNRSTAATAADGWGNDRRVAYESEADASGYAWVIRWDDAANASEFAAAFERFLDRKATRDGDLWRSDGGSYRFERVDDRTTAVLLGDRSFVTGTTVTASGDDVTVAGPAEPTPTASPTPTSTPTVSPTPTISPTTTAPPTDTTVMPTGTGSPTETTGEGDDVEVPGFGPIAGLVALAAAAQVWARRRH